MFETLVLRATLVKKYYFGYSNELLTFLFSTLKKVLIKFH